MTRQSEFRAEMAALFKKYEVEMEVIEDLSGYSPYVEGINFYSFVEVKDEKGEHSHFDTINFDVSGRRAIASSFEE